MIKYVNGIILVALFVQLFHYKIVYVMLVKKISLFFECKRLSINNETNFVKIEL